MRIKNNTQSIQTWCGQEIASQESYSIQAMEIERFANDNTVIVAISNEEAIIGSDDEYFTDINQQINYLKGNEPIKVSTDSPLSVTPTAPLNEYGMEQWGCTKGCFTSNNLVHAITLSNMSQDGKTFDYTCSHVLNIGDYVFMNDFCDRSWITSFTETTVTFEMPYLENGTGVYSEGYFCDELVRDWKPLMYLWGMFFNARNYSDNDFLELSVVDSSDMFKDDTFCQAMFGCDADEAEPYIIGMGFEDIGEFGHWTKYYDEQWILNAFGNIRTPDGSPGTLIPGLVLRLKFFPTEAKETKTHFYIDYSPTSKT